MLARLSVLIGLALATVHGGQFATLNPESCDRYARTEPPPADLPTDADRRRLGECDSMRLYFGFDKPPRAVDARKCAYLQWQALVADDQKYFSAPSILTMIYANGRGTARNFDLALKFACEIGGAPAENSGRVEHLERLKKRRWTGDNFHVCDDITSHAMSEICAAFSEQLHQRARER